MLLFHRFPDGTSPLPADVSLPDLLTLRDDTAQPMYLQLFQQLLTLMNTGQLPAGSTLPAERHLAERLGVSRSTVQRCYGELRKRELIQAHGRQGFIVQRNARVNPGMDKLKGFTDEMRELGMVASTRILEREVLGDRSIASIFGGPSHASFLKLVRVRYGDALPMSHEVAWYDLSLVPGLATADLSGSVYAWIGEHGPSPLAYCRQTVEAALPTPAECEIFGFSSPVPCLLIKRRTYNAADQMVEYVEGLFRGDVYTYKLTLTI